MIVDLVVDQTGYDEDIIDMDADLEGELGVDSIKRAQLIGELETHYNLQSLRETNLQLSDFPTLASIHSYVLNHLQQSGGGDSLRVRCRNKDLVFAIRTWGSYADGVAFAILLMNMAVPTIDFLTKPHIVGHTRKPRGLP